MEKSFGNKKMNILWLMTDEQSTDSLGCYGSAWANSPSSTDSPAKAWSLKMRSRPPCCIPARVSIATGKMPHETGCWHNDWQAEQPLDFLTHRFAEAGYQTAGFGKMHFNSPNQAFETQEEITLSKHVDYFDYEKSYDESEFDVVKYPGEKSRWILGGRFPAPIEETSEHRVTSKALDWLSARDKRKPFFLKVSFNGPHTPVVPPKPYDRIIPDGGISINDSKMPPEAPEWVRRLVTSGYADASLMDNSQIMAMRRYYFGYTAFLDSEFGRLITYLEKENILDNTLVAFTSDHGTHLGDFGMLQKQTFFDPVIRVPLLFRFPKAIPYGTRIASPVSTASLLPTMLHFAGLPMPPDDSPSLNAHLNNDASTTPVMSELMYTPNHLRCEDRFIMIRDRTWKLSFPQDHYPESAFFSNTNDVTERNQWHCNKGAADELYRSISYFRDKF